MSRNQSYHPLRKGLQLTAATAACVLAAAACSSSHKAANGPSATTGASSSAAPTASEGSPSSPASSSSGTGSSAPASAPASAPVSASAAANAPTAAEIDKALNTPATLTYWTWAADNSIPLSFHAKYPNIKINIVNAGVGGTEYQKLTTALNAGSGVPDVVFMDASTLPTFVQSNSLLDLNTLGASSLEPLYDPTAWRSVSLGGEIAGLPIGGQPIGDMYRTDLFQKAGITTAPATWDEFAKDAQLIKDKTGAYITNLPSNDPSMLLGFFQQAGAVPWNWVPGSKNISININSPEMKTVAAYWNSLVQKKLVSSDPDFVSTWYQNFNADKYASFQVPAWGSSVLSPTVTKSAGKWRVAELPQWTPGAHASGLWSGGSSDAILKSTKNPVLAYEFLQYIDANHDNGVKELALGDFPVLKSVLTDPTFAGTTTAYLGGQKAYALYAQIQTYATKTVWHYPPFMSFVYTAYTGTVGKATTDGTDLVTALDAWQKQVVDFAKQQGFTVN